MSSKENFNAVLVGINKFLARILKNNKYNPKNIIL